MFETTETTLYEKTTTGGHLTVKQYDGFIIFDLATIAGQIEVAVDRENMAHLLSDLRHQADTFQWREVEALTACGKMLQIRVAPWAWADLPIAAGEEVVKRDEKGREYRVFERDTTQDLKLARAASYSLQSGRCEQLPHCDLLPAFVEVSVVDCEVPMFGPWPDLDCVAAEDYWEVLADEIDAAVETTYAAILIEGEALVDFHRAVALMQREQRS